MPDPIPAGLDHPTLRLAIQKLEDRLQAVITYGAGGCPTCHDAELRGAIAILKRLMDPQLASSATATMVSNSRKR